MTTRTTPTAIPTTTGPAPHAVEVRDLTTADAGCAVADAVSFDVEEGEIFAILDPDSARTSQTVECIAGLRVPDTGTVRVFGYDPVTDRTRVRSLLGVQLHEGRLQDERTVREIVDTHGRRHPEPLDSGELLERLGLDRIAGTHYGNLSRGQRRRVSLAVALVGRPRVVVLDAPTTGLDPQSRRQIWSLVSDLRDSGVTVLLVTPLMDEAERLADRVALIDRGRLVAVDTPRGLVASAGLQQQVRFSTKADLHQDWIRRLTEVSNVARDGDQFVVTGDDRMLFSVVALLAAHDIVPARLEVDQPTLDDAFAALTGRRPTTHDGATR